MLHYTLERSLDGEIRRVLDARAADVSLVVTQAAEEGSSVELGAVSRGAASSQVLDERGRVAAATGIDLAALLGADQLSRAATRRVDVRRTLPAGDDAAIRIVAEPIIAGGRRFRVLAGERLDQRDHVLGTLKALLVIGGAIALIVASLAAYGLATAALRPVEAMRRRAEGISGREPGARLPLGPAGDELHRLGETLNEMLARIDRAIAHERAFVADASHELRSPLTILKGELELALRPGRSPDELRAAVRSAGEETDRLVQFAEDLLVIARMDEGGLPVRPERLDARDLLDDVRARFAGRAARAGREITADAAGPMPFAVDRPRLEQALANLVENALRHGAGPITLAARRRDGMVELHVRDEGPGIPPRFADDAFDRFTRADPARGRGGAGLGLAIVDAIARAHGGSAGIGRPDVGADVWIAIPADGSQAGGDAPPVA